MASKKYRVILWGAWYGSKNVGDRALLLSISDLLGEVIEKIEFIVITANPALVHSYTKRDSMYQFTTVQLRNQFIDVIKAFMSADLFIFGGGVPFYDDISHSVAIFLLGMLAKLSGTPYLLWSVSSLPVRSAFTRLVLRCIVPGAFLITCRDSHTMKLLQECGVKGSEVQIIPDAAFTLQSGNIADAADILQRAGWRPGETRPLVALTPRFLRAADGEAHTHYIPRSSDDNQKEVEVFAAVLDWLWENGYRPIFVPMNTIPPDSDLDSARQIIAYSKYGENALIICEDIHPRTAANIYSHCQAAFVARVHGSVTAFLGHCPSLMYAFGLKHFGIMEHMDMAGYIFDPDRHSKDDAVALISKILALRVDLIAQIKEVHIRLVKGARIPLDEVLKIQKLK